MAPPALTLYGFVPFDRSGRVRWLLHELGLAFQDRRLNFQEGENQTEDYLALNPTSRVPTLVDGDLAIHESGACLQYLAETYGAGKAAPGGGDPERAAYLTWMYFATSTLDPVCFELVRPDLNEEERPVRVARAERELPRLLRAVDDQLGEKDFLLEFGFTTADIVVATCLGYAASKGQLEDFPRLVSYLGRLQERRAAEEAALFPG